MKRLRFDTWDAFNAWQSSRRQKPQKTITRIVASEDEEQIALIARAAVHTGTYPALSLLVHIPNGGSRHKIEAAKLQAMGVQPGMPDLVLFWQARGFGAWCCELKALDGKPTPDQVKVINELKARGYFADFFYGQDAAWASLMWYLGA